MSAATVARARALEGPALAAALARVAAMLATLDRATVRGVADLKEQDDAHGILDDFLESRTDRAVFHEVRGTLLLSSIRAEICPPESGPCRTRRRTVKIGTARSQRCSMSAPSRLRAAPQRPRARSESRRGS